MQKYDKPHRLKDYNYSSAGSYMVTFCTLNRQTVLSEIEPPNDDIPFAHTKLTEIGQIVECYIHTIPDHYQNVTVDAYVIMPDHVHILLSFESEEKEEKIQHSRLSRIVHALKSLTTKEIGSSIWQLDYYDCIAFSEKEYGEFYDYIQTNPYMWYVEQLNN